MGPFGWEFFFISVGHCVSFVLRSFLLFAVSVVIVSLSAVVFSLDLVGIW